MKLIDKDALVAEIDRRVNAYQKNFDKADNKIARLSIDGRIAGLKSLLNFIDTLESKEAVLLTLEEIKKICTIYDNLKQERECATVLYNSDETFFNHVLMEYKSIAKTT